MVLLSLLAAALTVGTLQAQKIAQEFSAPEAFLELAPSPPGKDLIQNDPLLLEALRAAQVSVDVAPPMRVETNAAVLAEEPPPDERRTRVGRTHALGADVNFQGVTPDELTRTPRRLQHGAIVGTENGFVWDGAVQSPGAVGLRLRFVGFFLPRNAELYLYTDLDEVFGPYTGRGLHGDGEFWSHTVRGSRVNLLLRYEGGDLARVLRAARFVIADVAHLDSNFPFADPEQSNLCSSNADCIENASCPAASVSPVQLAQDATALIEFVQGPWVFICSGALVADTDPNSVISYFLTANHCLSKNRTARTLEAFFQFIKPCNGGSCGLTGTQIARPACAIFWPRASPARAMSSAARTSVAARRAHSSAARPVLRQSTIPGENAGSCA